MDSHGALDEATFTIHVGELNARQVDDAGLCILHAVHELLGLLCYGCQQDKSTEDSCPDQNLLDVELLITSLRAYLTFVLSLAKGWVSQNKAAVTA